jgi:hypothetical protein
MDVRLFVLLSATYQEAHTWTAKTNHTKLVQWIIIGVTVVVTIGAQRFLRAKQQEVKPSIIYERRKRRQIQFEATGRGNNSADSIERGDVATPLVGYPPTTVQFGARAPQ